MLTSCIFFHDFRPSNVSFKLFQPKEGENVSLRNPVYSCYILDNIAVGKPTAQSSTAKGAESKRAVDGNKSGKWNDDSCTRTKAQEDPWFRVDLQKDEAANSSRPRRVRHVSIS